jgi:hypothetical protein
VRPYLEKKITKRAGRVAQDVCPEFKLQYRKERERERERERDRERERESN